MSHSVSRLSVRPIDAATALCEVTACADAIIQTVRVSRALVVSGRLVSLDGLEQQIAQLCARCLGLHPDDGRRMRLHLLALRAELDATTALLAARYQQGAP